ncbi:MAG: lipid II flippase Amj family protein, partial [bacterium]|nr:lipid II flippase Amj family protein [bacterium]
LLVEPSIALITDDAVDGKRPVSNVCAMSIFLAGGTIFGTLLSQVIFVPAAEFIKWCSGLLTMVL